MFYCMCMCNVAQGKSFITITPMKICTFTHCKQVHFKLMSSEMMFICFRYKHADNVKYLEECSALDPRFKGLSWLPAEESAAVYSRVTSLITDEIDAQQESKQDTVQRSEIIPDPDHTE